MCRCRRRSSSRVSTSSRSARSPPRCARCVRPSRTRARASATQVNTFAGRSARGHERPNKARGAGAPSSPCSRQGARDVRASASRRVALEQGHLGAARRRHGREDTRGSVVPAAEVLQGQQDSTGGGGREAAGAEREAGRHRGRGLRPRRLPVPRPRQGARRRSTRGGTQVLSTRPEFTPVERQVIEREETRELKERVVEINRVAKVVKGGRRFSFTALVVIGDEVDRVGVGYGKAREVPLAITKAVEDAKKNLFTVPKHGTTITHEILGRSDAARVLLRPASEGTGVIAGGGVRAVLELAGIRDILAKSLGTTNPINMAKATVNGLKSLRRPDEVAKMRGLTISQVLPYKAAEEDEQGVSGSEPQASSEPAAPQESGEGS